MIREVASQAAKKESRLANQSGLLRFSQTEFMAGNNFSTATKLLLRRPTYMYDNYLPLQDTALRVRRLLGSKCMLVSFFLKQSSLTR